MGRGRRFGFASWVTFEASRFSRSLSSSIHCTSHLDPVLSACRITFTMFSTLAHIARGIFVNCPPRAGSSSQPVKLNHQPPGNAFNPLGLSGTIGNITTGVQYIRSAPTTMEEEDPPKLTALFEVFDRRLPELEKAGPGYKKVTKALGRLTQATEACKVLINVSQDFYRDAGYSALRKVHQQDPTLELQSPRSGRRRLKTEADVVMATAKYILGYIDECIETLYPNLSYQQSEAGPFRPRKKPNKGAEALQQEDDLQEELHIPDIRNFSAMNRKLTLLRHEMTIPGQKNAKKTESR